MEKIYDVILYGATGFTGKQTVKYFSENADKKLVKWAIAGRNKEKLGKIKKELGESFNHIDIVVADMNNEQSIEDMVASTKVILTTVGPFALYGEPVIKACVKFNTDYVDITGETTFIKKMIEKYHQEAKTKGIKIIPFCGFDSVPSDLGTLFAVDYFKTNFNLETTEVKAFFQAAGGINGGTIASLVNLAESDSLAALKDPEILNPIEYKNPGKKFADDNQSFYFDKDLNAWTAPFFMAPINTRVVRRSNALFSEENKAYGKNFEYLERMYFDEIIPIKSSVISLITKVISGIDKYPFILKSVKNYLPAPGSGPSEKTMNTGYFKTWIIAKAQDNSKIKVFIYSKGDPGNKVTVKILCESALSLCLQRDQLPGGNEKGGILTPATGLGFILIERLKKQGFRFEIIRKY